MANKATYYISYTPTDIVLVSKEEYEIVKQENIDMFGRFWALQLWDDPEWLILTDMTSRLSCKI